MLPAQLVNVAEAALGETPSPADFLKGLKQAMESQDAAPADEALFGDTFPTTVPQPEGSEKNQKGAYVAITNFEKFCQYKGFQTDNLDIYMLAFAKWVLCMPALFDTEAEQVAFKAKKNEL